MFKSLRRRFTAMNMLVISLLVLAAFLVVYLLAYTGAQREIGAELEMLLSGAGDLFGADGKGRPSGLEPRFSPPEDFAGGANAPGEPPAEAPADSPFGGGGGSRIGFVVRYTGSPADGTLAYETAQPRSFYNVDDLDVEAMLTEALAGGKRDGKLRSGDYEWTYRLGAGAGGTQQVAFLETSQSRGMLLNLVTIFSAVAVVLLAAIWLVSRWFAGRSIAPIEAAYNAQRRFIQDASHELRTPVAVIKTNLELMSSHPDDTVASQRDWMDNMRQETVHMEHLTAELLALARAENEAPEAGCARISLSDAVQDSVLPLEAVLYEKDLHFTAQVAEGLTVEAVPGDIGRLVHVLMENAIQYTPKGGHITLELQAAKRKAVLKVTNTGQGIRPDDLPHIFKRFYRADPTRSRATGGTGLGLSIAEGIVRRCGGTLSAASAPGVSTTFTVTLPTA